MALRSVGVGETGWQRQIGNENAVAVDRPSGSCGSVWGYHGVFGCKTKSVGVVEAHPEGELTRVKVLGWMKFADGNCQGKRQGKVVAMVW